MCDTSTLLRLRSVTTLSNEKRKSKVFGLCVERKDKVLALGIYRKRDASRSGIRRLTDVAKKHVKAPKGFKDYLQR